MKKFFIFVMSLLIASATFAQESNRDANGNFQYGPYETNSFWSNWFVEAGVGTNLGIDRYFVDDVKEYAHGWGLETTVSAGKFFTPEFGARVGWQGLNTSWNGWAWPWNEDAEKFNYAHGDFLWNITNQFWGYKEDRLINVVPFVSTGLVWNDGKTNFGIGGGVEFPVRVSDRVAIVPGVKAFGVRGTNIDGLASANVSVRVNLGKTNWTRKATTVAYYEGLNNGYTARLEGAEASVKALDAKNRSLAAHNASLQNEIARLVAENKWLKAQANKGVDTLANNFVTYFEIGKSALTAQEEAHLATFLNNNLKANKVRVSVAGSTDTATGSKNRNTVLRKQRAEYVANFIRKAYNVDVEVDTNGTEDLIKETPALSRAAVISW